MEISRMKLWYILLFISLLLTNCVHDAEGSIIRFEGTPTEIKDGLTSTMTLHCALNDSAASTGIIGRRDVTQTSDNVAEVSSLIIMKDGHEIAAVSHSIPARAINGSSNVQVTGSVSSTTGERGFIEITFRNPSHPQTGEYVCEANAISSLGHNVVFSTSLEIGISSPNMTDLLSYIRDLKSGVLFSVALTKSAIFTQGNNVVYDTVYSNLGGGYNSSTGEFTCPKPGYYKFEMSALGPSHKAFWLNLQHNGKDIMSIHGALASGSQGTTNSVIIQLATGDVVRVVVWYQTANLLSNGPNQIYATFNGMLVVST